MNPNMQQQFQQMGSNMPTTQLMQQQLQSVGPGPMSGGNMMQTGPMNPAVSAMQGNSAMQVQPGMQGPIGAANSGIGNNASMNFVPSAAQMMPGGPQAQVAPQPPQQPPQQAIPQQWDGNAGFNPMQQQQNQPPAPVQPPPNQPQQQAFFNQQAMGPQSKQFNPKRYVSSRFNALFSLLPQLIVSIVRN